MQSSLVLTMIAGACGGFVFSHGQAFGEEVATDAQDANDISFLQASLDFQQPGKALDVDPITLAEQASAVNSTTQLGASTSTYPSCQAHEGTVWAFCNGYPHHRWGIGPEGESRAIGNCNYAARHQRRWGTCPPVPMTRYFPACSSARCGNSASSCNHYSSSGCPSTMTRPWTMCEDHTGVYHCRPHDSWGNAAHQSGTFDQQIASSNGYRVSCVGTGNQCVYGDTYAVGTVYTGNMVQGKLSYCNADWCKDGDHVYRGCKSGGSWSRPYGDVALTADGAQSCLAQCRDGGYRYGGLECPMSSGNTVHCQCAHSATINEGTGSCERSAGHCNGAAMFGGYRTGGHSRGSVYETGVQAPAYTYVGCKSGGSWSRPYGDVALTGEGALSCLEQCRNGGYRYGGLECPMSSSNTVHCQCAHSASANLGGGSCSNSAGHCNGPVFVGGYHTGGHSRGSVYDVDDSSSLCPNGCTPNLVFLDDDVVWVESAASNPHRFAGKVYVPAWMTDTRTRVYEIDVSQSPPTKTVKVDRISKLAGGTLLKPFGSKLASDGVLFVLDFPAYGDGWLIAVDLASASTPTVAQFRTCQPNDLDIHEENGGNDITAFVGQAYRSEAWVGSNYKCSVTGYSYGLGSAYGSIIQIKVKENGQYKCGPGRGSADRCSWANYDQYAENTDDYQNSRWPVLGRSDQCCDNYGLLLHSLFCECMTGPIAGISYHAGTQQIWTAQLLSLVRTDKNTGASSGQLTSPHFYGEFPSEYENDGYHNGAVDNTKWLADGNTLIMAIYEAFFYSGTLASLDEQYGGPLRDGRKRHTKFAHTVAMAFCPLSYSDSAMSAGQITKLFKYNPSTDPRLNLNEHNRRACQGYSDAYDDVPSNAPNGWVDHTINMPCFSGRVTHLEPVTSHDSFVGVNYQSKAVLVLQNAQVSRLECNNWQR